MSLLDKSGLFKDIADSPLVKKTDEDIIIEFDASARPIITFLALISSSLTQIPEHTFQEILELMDIMKKMQVSSFDRKLQGCLDERAGKEPWTAFLYAAANEDIRLARLAISGFCYLQREDGFPPTQLPDFDEKAWIDVPDSWIIKLLRRGWDTGVLRAAHFTQRVNWALISANFLKDIDTNDPQSRARSTGIKRRKTLASP